MLWVLSISLCWNKVDFFLTIYYLCNYIQIQSSLTVLNSSFTPDGFAVFLYSIYYDLHMAVTWFSSFLKDWSFSYLRYMLDWHEGKVKWFDNPLIIFYFWVNLTLQISSCFLRNTLKLKYSFGLILISAIPDIYIYILYIYIIIYIYYTFKGLGFFSLNLDEIRTRCWMKYM